MHNDNKSRPTFILFLKRFFPLIFIDGGGSIKAVACRVCHCTILMYQAAVGAMVSLFS